MEAPLGLLFLKKAELYNLITRLDERKDIITDGVKDKSTTSRIPSSWPIEKNILMWSFYGHKHLGSPIKYEHFELGKHCKLKDWKLCENNDPYNNEFVLKKEYAFISNKGNLKEINRTKVKKIFENMVIREFASYSYKEGDTSKKEFEGIILNKEGLLLGEVIYNVNAKPCIKRIYHIYSWLMDYGGAWVLLILFIITIIATWLISFWNIFSQLITWIINLCSIYTQSG